MISYTVRRSIAERRGTLPEGPENSKKTRTNLVDKGNPAKKRVISSNGQASSACLCKGCGHWTDSNAAHQEKAKLLKALRCPTKAFEYLKTPFAPIRNTRTQLRCDRLRKSVSTLLKGLLSVEA